MPDWVSRGWQEYARRLPRHLRLDLVEVPSVRNGPDRARREGRALLQRCGNATCTVALDARGGAWTTRELAGRLEQWIERNDSVALLVGGADGHCESLLDQCDARWSLGPLTLPHMLVRVIVCEQIYRAWTILSGHPYHRG